jgi:sigma-B regulation protein RsbU (phosphoserine phosphatase)
VSGKGLPAGLIASSLQARLEAVAGHRVGGAVDVVAGVNRVLCDRSEASRFATLSYLELDTHSHRAVIVNAGHLPALILSPSGSIARVSATAPALGIVSDARVLSSEHPIAAGDLVLFYSDGVTEAFDPQGVEYGEDRLAQLALTLIERTAAAICQEVVNDVRRHSVGGITTDDVTVLAIRRDGGSR